MPQTQKSTTEEIRARFDNDVERFSNLETGQQAVIDAPLMMDLITTAALACNPAPKTMLDIGTGAGNNTLKLLEHFSPIDCDLVDLSQPMLERAKARVAAANAGNTRTFRGDFRTIPLPENHYDVIIAAAVLHHLRDDTDWETAFHKMYRLTAPEGSVWITDLITQEISPVHSMMWHKYGDYLSQLGGDAYRDTVFAYIEKEDSPRPVTYQLDLLRKVGFKNVDLLHKNSCFAAFGAIKK